MRIRLAIAVMIVLVPTAALAQLPTLPYNHVIIGGTATPSDTPELETGLGWLASGSWSPASKTFVTLAAETSRIRFTVDGERGTVSAAAYVATGGVFLPVHRRVHLLAGVGIVREAYRLTFQGQSARLSGVGWMATTGARVQLMRRVELSVELQRLRFRNEEIDDTWPLWTTTVVTLTPRFGVVGALLLEAGQASYGVGLRTRF